MIQIPIGSKFGRLTTISETRRLSPRKYITVVDCICECGNTKVTNVGSLTHGSIKSCGCIMKEIHKNLPRKQSKQ